MPQALQLCELHTENARKLCRLTITWHQYVLVGSVYAHEFHTVCIARASVLFRGTQHETYCPAGCLIHPESRADCIDQKEALARCIADKMPLCGLLGFAFLVLIIAAPIPLCMMCCCGQPTSQVLLLLPASGSFIQVQQTWQRPSISSKQAASIHSHCVCRLGECRAWQPQWIHHQRNL